MVVEVGSEFNLVGLGVQKRSLSEWNMCPPSTLGIIHPSIADDSGLRMTASTFLFDPEALKSLLGELNSSKLRRIHNGSSYLISCPGAPIAFQATSKYTLGTRHILLPLSTLQARNRAVENREGCGKDGLDTLLRPA